MSEIETAILEHLRDGPASVAPLRSRYAKASIYDALRRLRSRGVVVPGDGEGVWRLVQTEPAALDPTAPDQHVWPRLPWPHLDLMPSTLHRAIAEPVLLSRLVRLAYERHHASYVLFSAQGLRGKTWLMTALAIMLGVEDPESVIVHAGTETRGSLGVRRKGNGEVAQIRAALGGPILGIDEKRRGGRDVQKVIDVLISGSRSIPLEDRTLDVWAVIMIALNCPEGVTDIQEATGLDQPMQRRCLIANLDGVQLDGTFARDGEERLERLRALGPIALPEPGGLQAEVALGERLGEILPTLLDTPERMSSVDVVLLRQQAVAATWCGLSTRDALALVLHHACLIRATTGSVHPDWEARLAEAVASPGQEPDPAPLEPPHVFEPDPYQQRIEHLDEVARAHGLGEPAELEKALAVWSAMREAGVLPPVEKVPALAETVTAVAGPALDPAGRVRVLTTVDKLGLTAADAERVLRVAAAARATLGLEPEDLGVLAGELERSGYDAVAFVEWAVAVARKLGRLEGAVDEKKRELRAWRKKTEAAATDLMTINLRIEKLAGTIKEAHGVPALQPALRRADDEIGKAVIAKILKAAEEIATGRSSDCG